MSQANIKSVDALIAKLQAIRSDAGKDLLLNISVLHESKDNPFGCYYEDRQLSEHMEVVNFDGSEFLELYI